MQKSLEVWTDLHWVVEKPKHNYSIEIYVN